MESFGVDLKKCGAVTWKALNFVNALTLENVRPPMPVDGQAQYGAPLYSFHRSDLHTGLRETALSEDGLGPAVELQLSSRVGEYDSHTGTVTLEDGSSHRANLVIVADGVHSGAATYINGFDCPTQVTERTVIRFIIPTNAIRDDPVTAPLLNREKGLSTYVVPDKRDFLFLAHYNCRNDELQNFGMYISKPVIKGEDDHKKASMANRTTLIETMHDFHPALRGLCDKTEEILPLWRVTDRLPVPTCTKGRLLMIGDASHPMQPSQGQGFVNGVQDAGVLQVVLKGLPLNDASLLAKQLKVFQDIRQGRVAAIQLYSSKPIMENPAKAMEGEVRKWLPDEKLPTNQAELNDWLMTYHAMEDAEKTLKQSKS